MPSSTIDNRYCSVDWVKVLNTLGPLCLWECFFILDFCSHRKFIHHTNYPRPKLDIYLKVSFANLELFFSFGNLTVFFFVGNHCMLPVMTLRQLRHILPPKIPSCDIASISRRTWKQLFLSLTEPISSYRHQYHSKVFNISEGNANQFQYGLIAIESRF